MRKIIACLILATLSGCAGMEMVDEENYKREYVFDYTVPGKNKSDIFKAARDSLAMSYGDSNKVFRVLDENDGTIIGKGIARCQLAPVLNAICDYDYNIKFMSKDNRGRLQLTIGGVANPQNCNWDRPSAYGSEQISKQMNEIGGLLDKALSSGKSSSEW